jgi:hypothetical protein
MHEIHSWFSFFDIGRLSAISADAPTGLGHFDSALYISLVRQLEREAQRATPKSPYWVLDLGTYFGHSALTAAYAASHVSSAPMLNVLSIDIFEQPQWLLENNPEVGHFVQKYGSADRDGVQAHLDSACRKIGLANNPIHLLQRDVLTVFPEDLNKIAPRGFPLVMVDCGKTPELMNRINEFLVHPRVTPSGAAIAFQDFFDWHAPWNVYAFWRLLKSGTVSLHLAGPNVTPFARKSARSDAPLVCDRIRPSLIDGESWSTPFTSLENECAAFDDFIALFRRQNYSGFALRLECMKVGAFLRAANLDGAALYVEELLRKWPEDMSDQPLRNAYCRLMHMRTGHKDLTLVPAGRIRNSRKPFTHLQQMLTSRLNYLRPIRSKRAFLPVESRRTLDVSKPLSASAA